MTRTVEDFRVEDGKVYQVRRDDDAAFRAMMENCRHQVEAGAVDGEYRRTRFRIPNTVQMEIWKKHGREMDAASYGKMSPAMQRRFDRIIHSEYPQCVVGGWSQKYFQGA
ncbi:hypothetical protein [Microbulbifer sp. TYP-18]|uniref:hypothetical protein n=1 Tax=Microbulbifer sp. TYP-18 TaxID=3230024 RepID=UPI0034C6AB71